MDKPAPRLSRFLKFSRFSFRDVMVTVGPAIVIIGLALWGAYVWIDPTPPKHVVMATGPTGGDYAKFGALYRDVLRRYGIDLELRASLGSLDNLNALNDENSDVEIGFVRSGMTDEASAEHEGLVSLGSLFVEPLWLFYRSGIPIRKLAQLRGKRVDIGPEGSGQSRLINKIFEANHLDSSMVSMSRLGDEGATVALLEGRLDAVFLCSAPDSPLVQMLLRRPGIELFQFEQAEAYSRRYPFLKHVVLPRGIVDFERNIPSQDVDLIAPTATLVATDDTHPAILELLVEAASEIHGGASWFKHAGEFPNGNYSEIPVAKVATRFYKTGPPLLEHYLAFWAANLVDRMWLVFVSLLALIVPLARILPPLYQWRVRSRVYRWYGQLREVEQEVEQLRLVANPGDPELNDRLQEHLRRLDAMESRLNHVSVPLSYADQLYALRQHIDLVRERIQPKPANLDAT